MSTLAAVWNPAEVRVASGQNFCTKIISYIVLQTSVEIFEMSSQKNSNNAAPIVENKV